MCDPFCPTMSGEIFQPLETLEDQVEAGRGPLICRLCTQEYEDPRILNCYHAFCGNCLRGRAVDGFMTCPLCGTKSFLTSGSPLPPLDPVLTFLLKSSEQERAVCANCDSVQSSMFFCNTCRQALCEVCKEETHRAKMFSSHQMVALKRRTNDQHRKCANHGEDYIMYSTEKQDLLCIKCFRDFEKEDRAFCLDLESAYNQSCRHLEDRIGTIRDLQSSVHDAIILFQALMQEVRSNAEKERGAIQELCADMQERISLKKEELLKDVDSQHAQKEQVFKDQLPNLAALLPTLQTYLSVSTMFVNNANMYEFLDLNSSLMERLEAIAHQPHQLRPAESSEISTHYEAKFAKCLKPLLHVHLDDCSDCGSSSPIIHVSMPTAGAAATPQQSTPRLREATLPQFSNAYISSTLARHLSLSSGSGIRRGSKIATTIRHRMQEGNGPFVEHCKAFEANFRLLQHRIHKMKEQVQEIHRDITRRKCLARREKVTDILDECSQVEIQISTHTATLEHMKMIFEKIWQEMLDRVSNEQDIYQTQLKDMNYLKQENSHLATIARQIAPYISSIEAVAEQIDPRRVIETEDFSMDTTR
ncbi:RING finger protein 207-like [Diadema antillarum]|uniref:RING finger protein 207-like n=1 Tax=Diadema antillarum TaxID=105358 RepID=UPI003A873505